MCDPCSVWGNLLMNDVNVTCVLSWMTCLWMMSIWPMFCLEWPANEWCVHDQSSVWSNLCMNAYLPIWPMFCQEWPANKWCVHDLTSVRSNLCMNVYLIHVLTGVTHLWMMCSVCDMCSVQNDLHECLFDPCSVWNDLPVNDVNVSCVLSGVTCVWMMCVRPFSILNDLYLNLYLYGCDPYFVWSDLLCMWPVFCQKWPVYEWFVNDTYSVWHVMYMNDVYETCVLSDVTCVWMICMWPIFCLTWHVYMTCVLSDVTCVRMICMWPIFCLFPHISK